MRKTWFTIVGALLIAASTAQIASAAESRHAHKAHVTYQQFRNTNNAIPAPATSNELIEYSGGWYGPLGHSAM